jgi:hypothetical protein
MPFFIISLIFQVALVVHIVKTGRNTMWIWIVIMLPLAGSIAYLLIEVLPSLGQSRTGRSAVRKVTSTLNPNRDLQQALNEFERSDTIENKMKLANELLVKEQFEKARELLSSCLSGIYQTDPYIMLGLAKAQFGCKQIAQAKSTLDGLIEHNPDFKDHGGHLLYARCLEGLEDYAAASHEYDALRLYYAGPEAKYRYAILCIKMDKHALAKELFDEILLDAKNGGHHYNNMHREWISQTKAQRQALH